jgi:hypothetical protein
MVSGTHRRRTASTRPSRGAVWTGLFLLLALVAVVASRGLWSRALSSLLDLRPASVPQASVLWQVPCPAGSSIALNVAGQVLIVTSQAESASTSVDVAADGTVTTVTAVPGLPLTAAFYDPGFTQPPGGRAYSSADWRAVIVRQAQLTAAAADAAPEEQLVAGDAGSFAEEVYCLEAAGVGAAPDYVAPGAVVTAAYPWVDQAEIILGVYDPGGSADPEGSVVAVGSGGVKLWAHSLGPVPVHRVTGRPGTGLVAAATPEIVALLDGRGSLLWTRKLKAPAVDLAIQSHGGPVVVSSGSVLAYDRRGNLVWKKTSREPLRAVVCAGYRIAVAAGACVVVYDEDGLEKWSLVCSAGVLDVALDPTGKLAAALLESGTLVLARGPGVTPVGATPVAGEGCRP